MSHAIALDIPLSCEEQQTGLDWLSEPTASDFALTGHVEGQASSTPRLMQINREDEALSHLDTDPNQLRKETPAFLGSVRPSLLVDLPPQHPSSAPALPTSVFHMFGQQPLGAPRVRISVCQPHDAAKASAAGAMQMPSSAPGELLRRSRELSGSDSMDAWHVPLPRSSSSLTPSTSAPTPVSEATESDREAVQIVRPTIQTGMHMRAGAAPAAPGGKRVLRTAEERKQHRMAKNRATAAASRKRKQAVKEDLLSKQEDLRQENLRLQQLLGHRDQEIAGMREQIAMADMFSHSDGDSALLPDPFSNMYRA